MLLGRGLIVKIMIAHLYKGIGLLVVLYWLTCIKVLMLRIFSYLRVRSTVDGFEALCGEGYHLVAVME